MKRLLLFLLITGCSTPVTCPPVEDEIIRENLQLKFKNEMLREQLKQEEWDYEIYSEQG